MSDSDPRVLLFTYGTLQRPDVQIASFGRQLEGKPDSLPGYVRFEVHINDPSAAEWLGLSHYYSVEPSANPTDSVPGTVFEITEQELAAADQYEEDAEYYRIRVTLQSGTEAWVYLRPYN